MFTKSLFLLFTLCLVLNSNGQRNRKFFRKDYEYIDSTQAFYKIHTLGKSWSDAKRMCSLEGATLFYPENEDEAISVVEYLNSSQPFRHVYVGISDLVAKGVFETIDGLPVSDVYNKWSPGEPNDAGGVEDCVVMNIDGAYNDDNCAKKFPFICKKSLQSLEWNQPCNMPNLDYIFNEQVGKCYKFHVKPLNWTEAYAVCSAERSYLAVINTEVEANFLTTLTMGAPKDRVPGNFMHGAILLGFHSRLDEGWKTVRGTSLEDSGYTLWGTGQPDGKGLEQCGSMFHNGRLNDIACDQKCFFICEHDIDTLASSFNDRFGDQ
ncbi:C-type mannose receptor 2-like [Anticarsia gemmatalis]|uniref:C-type mannose receptor 2-like n=1 Tax=Anticarsia gemmatalis TaxID=129554 RepID=UPI003F769473